MSNTKLLLLDRLQSQDGKVPAIESEIELAYVRHFTEWDAKRCEAQVIEESLPQILQIRALLFRGRHVEAEEIMSQVVQLGGDSLSMSEVLLERLKLAALDGDWRLCVDLASALHTGPL